MRSSLLMPATSGFLFGTQVLMKSLDVAYKVGQKCPVTKKATGVVLDTLFGPEEPFDYVPIPAPTPPQPHFP